MSLRFRSQLQIDNLPDQMLESKFEVLMPALDLLPKEKLDSRMTKLASSVLPKYYPIVEEINFGLRDSNNVSIFIEVPHSALYASTPP